MLSWPAHNDGLSVAAHPQIGCLLFVFLLPPLFLFPLSSPAHLADAGILHWSTWWQLKHEGGKFKIFISVITSFWSGVRAACHQGRMSAPCSNPPFFHYYPHHPSTQPAKIIIFSTVHFIVANYCFGSFIFKHHLELFCHWILRLWEPQVWSNFAWWSSVLCNSPMKSHWKKITFFNIAHKVFSLSPALVNSQRFFSSCPPHLPLRSDDQSPLRSHLASWTFTQWKQRSY